MIDNRFIDLANISYGDVKDNRYDMAILPWGATEPHNYHLPYLTDSILSHDIAVEASIKANKAEGINAMVLPAINCGSQNPGQHNLPFCIHYRYETQKAILNDTVAALNRQGITKLLIINGHGGNTFKNMIRDLYLEYPNFLIATTEWFNIVPVECYFDEDDDHAGEIETSVMMHYHPEYVTISNAGSGEYTPFSMQSLNSKIAWVPRHWDKATKDTGIGNPKYSTAEKGKRYTHAVSDKLSELIIDLSKNNLYEK